MMQIQAPSKCPSCGSHLEWKNHILYCLNSDCTSQVGKRIEHFAKVLKIKGLGPVTVVKLGLNSFAELYEVTQDYLEEVLGSEKLSVKLMEEIEKSKQVSLNQLLPAFSIRLIGKTAAEKLSFVCKDITEINKDTCAEAGLGPKATTYLIEWLESSYPKIANLPFSFTFDRVAKPKVLQYVCISGKLKSFKTKALATEALLGAGYGVKGTLTKQVTILINESGIESSKTKQAKQNGITIITDMYDLIGETKNDTT